MNRCFWVAMAALLSGCASQLPTLPYKRPMQESYQPALKDLQVYTYAEERGLGVGYYQDGPSSEGVLASTLVLELLPGYLVSVLTASVSNAMARSESASLATELAKGFDRVGTERQLQAALASSLREVPWLRPQAEVKHMNDEQWLEAGRFAEPAVMTVVLDYVMSPELTHLYLIADVRVLSKELRYAGLYPRETEVWAHAAEERERAERKARREGKPPPKEAPIEARDQLYRNILVFTSAELPLAFPSNAEINKQSQAIRARYLDARGQLTNDREQLLKMNRELRALKEATSQEYLRARRAEFWVANDGAELKRVINEGVQTLAQLLARDLQDTQLPSLTPAADDHVEPMANGSRQLVRKASGVSAGQYVSVPVPLRVQPWNSIARGD